MEGGTGLGEANRAGHLRSASPGREVDSGRGWGSSKQAWEAAHWLLLGHECEQGQGQEKNSGV